MRILFLTGVLLAAAPGIAPASAQDPDRPQITDQDRTRGHRMLRKMVETLEEYYYDTTYHGIDLEKHVAKTDSAIDAATSVPHMFAILADFLNALDDSHTRFTPPGINTEVKYGWSWQMIGNDCHVVSVTEKSDAEAKGLRVGDKVLAIDGIRPVRENLDLVGYVYYQLRPRAGMRLLVERDGGERLEIVVKSELKRTSGVINVADLDSWRRYVEEARRSQVRRRLSRSLDSVLVWHLPSFVVSSDVIDRMMEEARKHRWLIMDFRGNGGGYIAALARLLGHFFSEPFEAYTQVWRDSTVALEVKPQGHQPFMGETLILIDSRSGSAAEMSTRVLQMRGRATIVGDRSAGAVQTSYGIPLRLGTIFEERGVEFGMSVTINDVIMPDSSRLEKIGVTPNVAALPTGADLAAKRDPVMQFALEMAGIKVSADSAAKVLNR